MVGCFVFELAVALPENEPEFDLSILHCFLKLIRLRNVS